MSTDTAKKYLAAVIFLDIQIIYGYNEIKSRGGIL